jgi:hypothetical protein
VSPDGRKLAFTAARNDQVMLWVRDLDSLDAKLLAGTEFAGYPFWSPDSSSIGFFTESRLKVIDAAGGPPRDIANAVAGQGGAWNSNGTIVFSPPVARRTVLHVSFNRLALHVFPRGNAAGRSLRLQPFPGSLPVGIRISLQHHILDLFLKTIECTTKFIVVMNPFRRKYQYARCSGLMQKVSSEGKHPILHQFAAGQFAWNTGDRT